MFPRFFTLILTLVSFCHCAIDIEKYLKVCPRNSPDVNDCLVDVIQSGIAAMAGGIKDLDVPAVDPYIQKILRIEYKKNQVQSKMVGKDIRVEGLKGSTVRDARLRADEDNFHLEVDMFSPVITVSGKYEGTGSFNALNVTAYGTYITTMTDLVYTWKVDGKPETIDNEVYVRINSFYMRPDVSRLTVQLTNDSPATKELTKLGVQLVNDNWRVMYKELLPYLIENWDKIGTGVANKIFLKIPYNRLFPIN